MGERTKFPAAIAAGYEFLAENAAGRGHWDDALALRRAGSRRRAQGRLAGARRVEPSSARRRVCTARASWRRPATAAEAALELCEQIGEIGSRRGSLRWPRSIAADLGDDDAAREHRGARVGACASSSSQLLLTAWALQCARLRGDAARRPRGRARMVRAIRAARARHGERRRAAPDPARPPPRPSCAPDGSTKPRGSRRRRSRSRNSPKAPHRLALARARAGPDPRARGTTTTARCARSTRRLRRSRSSAAGSSSRGPSITARHCSLRAGIRKAAKPRWPRPPARAMRSRKWARSMIACWPNNC